MTTKALTITEEKQPIPRKLNSGMVKALAYVISKGNYAVVACQRCGIDESTYYNWIKQGDADTENRIESIYSRLTKSIKKASSEAEDLMVQRLRRAALPGVIKEVTKTDADGGVSTETVKTGGEWLAAATFLERRHPERWGRKDRSTLVIEETKQIVITTVEVVKDYGNRRIEEKRE